MLDPDRPRTTTAPELVVPSMFLAGSNPVPVDPIRAANRERPSGLVLWIAAGLSAVSIVGGMLYHLYYQRVGNEVTELLPRETVGYVRMVRPAQVLDGFQSLEMWATTRPVRDRLARHEQQLRTDFLLDFGVTRRVLAELSNGISAVHLAAVIPEHPTPGLPPYDFLLFLDLDSPADRTRLMESISPYFGPVEEDGGVEVLQRRMARGHLSLARLDDLVVLGYGSASALRGVFEAGDRGPSRSLNDSNGFRKAWRAHANEPGTDVWTYVRHEHLVDVALSHLLGPFLDEAQRHALAPYASVLRDAAIAGAGAGIHVGGGLDVGRLGFFATNSEGFARVAEQTGTRTMTTLRVIPSDAVLAVALTLDSPREIAAEWLGPMARLLASLTPPDERSSLGINEAQAKSGVFLAADVWPVLAGEIALARVPGVDDTLSWLGAFRVNDQERALDVVSRIARFAFRDQVDSRFGASLDYSDGTYRMPRYVQRGPSPDTRGETDDTERETDDTEGDTDDTVPEFVDTGEFLCWAAVDQVVVVSPTCSTVRAAVAAEASGQGMDVFARAALSTLPEQATVVALARLREGLERMTGPRAIYDLLRPDFMVAAAGVITPDRLELTANVSALSLLFLWTSSMTLDGETPASPDSCRQLAKAVCAAVGPATQECSDWVVRVEGSSQQACQTGLRTVNQFEKKPL
jgi:hypothetical protein